jgi:hypothetical protein
MPLPDVKTRTVHFIAKRLNPKAKFPAAFCMLFPAAGAQ